MKLLLAGFVSVLCVSPSASFAPPAPFLRSHTSLASESSNEEKASFPPPLHLSSLPSPSTSGSPSSIQCLAAAVASSPLFLLPSSAIAGNNSPDWGLFEGRTLSLAHPISMAALLALSLNAAFLGLKWRKQRTLGDDITALKKQLPPVAAVADGEVPPLPSSSTVALQSSIAELTAERKELAGQNNRDKHWKAGTTLAAVGTFFAIEGPLNTFARAGKLFPGPHLYAGKKKKKKNSLGEGKR